VGELWWLTRDAASGAVEVRDSSGTPVPARLAGDAESLFRSDGNGPRQAALRIAAGDSTLTPVLALPVPGRLDMLLAIKADEDDRRVAPAIETIVNQIAHDVRNYAFTVGLQAELGERRSDAVPEVRAHFAAVLRQVDALRGYLEQLLLYGRPVTLRPTATDVAALIRQQVQELQLSWRSDAPPPAVSVEVDSDIGEVRWDMLSMGHVLRALLDNAVRSADPSPPVTVRAARRGERVIVEVIDRGGGIPPDKIDLIWSPLRVRRHGGAGLGLAIARKIATAHGGNLELETGPTGTTARLDLPREVASG
jgi:signal transduction histidine kinase